MRSRHDCKTTLPGLVIWLLWSTAAAADDNGRDLRFLRFTRERGLSSDTVSSIVEDHHGFMWIGTSDGLNRFDGYELKTYRHDPQNPRSLSHSLVNSLLEDSTGTLWVTTVGGLNRYVRETDSFVRYLHADDDPTSLVTNTVYTVFEDSRGRLWVGTYLGLDRFERETETFVHYELTRRDPDAPRTPTVRAVVEDPQGILWIGSSGDGLYRFDPEDGSHTAYRHRAGDPASLSHDEVWALLRSHDGHLWVGTRQGLSRFDPGSGTSERFNFDVDDPGSLASDHVTSLFEDHRHDLWIGTDGGGLDRFDRETRAFHHHRNDPADETTLGSNVVRIITEDTKGDLWVGTYLGGLNFWNRSTAVFSYDRHRVNDPTSLSHSAVLSFYEDRDGVLWIGTEGGLNRYDDETGTYRSYRHDPRDPTSLGADAVLAILEDSRGRLWIGTFYGGLNLFDRRRETFERFTADPDDPRSLSNPHVWDVFEDHLGLLWLATFRGVNRLDPETGAFVHYVSDLDDDTTLPNDTVWDFCEDEEGTLWVATQNGLAAFDRETETFKTYRHREGDNLSHNQVLSVTEDSRGRLWIGTEGGGLLLFDRRRETFTTYTANDGLANDMVYDVVEDDRGHLWISTNGGLSQFDPQTETFRNYDKSDGLLSFPFSKTGFYKSRDGRIFIGGTNGWNGFLPEDVEDNHLVPPIVLTGITVMNEPVVPGASGSPMERHLSEAERIVLRHDQVILSFTFAALSYRAAEKNRYSFKLEGFDKDWTTPSPQRSATYTNLDPGTYTFRVKGSNSSGLWNEEGTSIEVVVLPPFWATWWFRSAAAFAVVALLLGFHQARLRSIEKRNRLLQAEITERLRVEAERGRLMHEMEEKNDELAAQNAELERFTYTVSHDLKSPLLTIKGFLGLIEKDVKTGDLERFEKDLRHVHFAADNMNRLLAELLELSRIGRLLNPPETVALRELATEALALVDGKVRARGARVVIEPEMPTVIGDRARLLEVFQNLLENAVKFMGEEKAPRIEVGGRGEDEVTCWVRDNGIGIEPRYSEKIFGLFERLDTSEEGTGIGLALARRIVEFHGGRIWVDSEGRGRGSTFWFTLPARPR